MTEVICLAVAAVLIGALFMMLWALLQMLWPVLLLAGVAYIAARRFTAWRNNNARLAQNAKTEHALIMQGDPRGYYGQYPPDVIPPSLASDNQWHITY